MTETIRQRESNQQKNKNISASMALQPYTCPFLLQLFLIPTRWCDRFHFLHGEPVLISSAQRILHTTSYPPPSPYVKMKSPCVPRLS